MHKVKTAAAKNQLFTKYMHLCRVAHDNGNLCVPGSIISNYGQSLTWLIQRDSSAEEDEFLRLRLSIPNCNEHQGWGRLKDGSEHIPFIVAGSLHDVEEAHGTDAADRALEQYLGQPGTIFPFGKACHHSTCVQVSHLTNTPASCHRQREMEELRQNSAGSVVPAACDNGCLPRQAIKTSKQLLVEDFCLIHHIEDPHEPSSWSDEMIGEGIHLDAPGILAESVSRDDFFMLSFARNSKVSHHLIKHIVNKIASINGTLLDEIDSATINNKYDLFKMCYFMETLFFSLVSNNSTFIASTDKEDEIIKRYTNDKGLKEYIN